MIGTFDQLKALVHGRLSIWVPEWINVPVIEDRPDGLVAFVHGIGRSPSDDAHAVSVVSFARSFEPFVSTVESARQVGRESVAPGRPVSVYFIDSSKELVSSGLDVASMRIRFMSKRDVPYEGVVCLKRTDDGLELVTRCLYPASVREEMFDYAHRQLMASVRLVDA